MTAIKSGTLVYKDKDGNTGIVKSLSDNDVSTINQALADVKEIKEGIAGNYVTTNTEQTIAAKKTFTADQTVKDSVLLLDRTGTPVTSTASATMLAGKFNYNADGSYTNTIPLISQTGSQYTASTGSYGTNVSFGSEGATVFGAGENVHKFIESHGIYTNDSGSTGVVQNDHLYITSDENMHFYTQVLNDGTGGTESLTITPSATTSNVAMYAPTPSASTNNTQVATTAWVRSNIHSIYNNNSNVEIETAAHNNFFRGANLLGSGHFSSMSALYTAISVADWSDIYVGDYVDLSLTDNGSTATRRFRVAGIDTALNIMSDNITKHHLVMIPDIPIRYAYMNSTNTTVGAYTGSYMYTTVLPSILTSLSGSSSSPFYGHIIAHNEYLTNSMSTSYTSANCPWATGVSNGCGWVSQSLVLMSTREVFGATSWDSSGFDSEVMNRQLPLFRLAPHFIGGGYTSSGAFQRDNWWLRSVANSANFCGADANGGAGYHYASRSFGVRPRFLIG